MSILIKGMKMPNCYNCTLESICSRWAKHDVEWQKQNRDEDCPLIELPVQHGRLIDADALQQSIKESIDECHKWADEVEGWEMYARVSQSLGTFVECSLRIKAAPTIIEEEVNK